MAEAFHLAQVNVATFRKPKDDPANLDFMNALDRVNGAAEKAPGFVWRLKDESGHSTNISFDPNPNRIVNLSIWEDVQSLMDFAYRQADHAAMLRRRDEWFDPGASQLALWWVRVGHRPDPAEAIARGRFLQKKGPTQKAFTFKDSFEPG